MRVEFTMKKTLIVIAVIALNVSLGAQSLVELAKQEKARREAFKGRPIAVILNRDLLAVKKTPAVEVGRAGEEEAGETPQLEPAADPDPDPDGTIPEGTQIMPRVEAAGPVLMDEGVPERLASSIKLLESQLQAAAELVDLLTTKMNALRQQYENQDAMVPGSVIQQQLNETNARLVKAQAQMARIQEELDKKKTGKRAGPGEIER
jgi:hypothetical protein